VDDNCASWSVLTRWLTKDPFDRILIAQAKAERLGLVTSDGSLSEYPVQTIW